jgi:hypothetical protein
LLPANENVIAKPYAMDIFSIIHAKPRTSLLPENGDL